MSDFSYNLPLQRTAAGKQDTHRTQRIQLVSNEMRCGRFYTACQPDEFSGWGYAKRKEAQDARSKDEGTESGAERQRSPHPARTQGAASAVGITACARTARQDMSQKARPKLSAALVSPSCREFVCSACFVRVARLGRSSCVLSGGVHFRECLAFIFSTSPSGFYFASARLRRFGAVIIMRWLCLLALIYSFI